MYHTSGYPEMPKEKGVTFPPAYSPDMAMQFEHFRELQRDAEQSRLVRLAREGNTTKRSWLSQALTSLGHLLVHWGCLLEQRSSTLLEPPCQEMGDRSRSSTTVRQGI